MHKLLILLMILFLYPLNVQAKEDIHIEITETGIQKTPVDDILLLKLVPGDKRTYTLLLYNESEKKTKALSEALCRRKTAC